MFFSRSEIVTPAAPRGTMKPSTPAKPLRRVSRRIDQNANPIRLRAARSTCAPLRMYPAPSRLAETCCADKIEIEARLHHGCGRGGEVGAGESLQVFGALIVGAHLDDRKCEQPRRQHVQRDRDVAEAELLGDNRAGDCRARVATAAEFLRNRAAHESELPCLRRSARRESCRFRRRAARRDESPRARRHRRCRESSAVLR